jgi:NAD(P)-dependent dehydrogenase (short-subunit alcohol dehydrogenase family)
LKGTLDEVAEEARSAGAAAVVAELDLLDATSIDRSVETAIKTLGRIDSVVHCATFTGRGMQNEILSLPLEVLDESLRANVVGSMHLAQCVLPDMLSRGSGVWISLVSGASVFDPPHRANEGGWGFLYAAQKAGLYRLAGVLNAEYGDRGIRAYNVQPGIVETEILRATLGNEGPLEKDWGIAPPEIPAAVIDWLIREDLDGRYLHRGVHAQKLAQKLAKELGVV